MRSASKISLLFFLYLSQGLPFGFQVTALPVLLREQGISLTAIGFAGALALPWVCKPLWAPLVDRYWSERLGRRRSWIIPLQICLVISMVLAIPFSISGSLSALMVCIFCMNLCAATQDIAVDGLAVDLLRDHELGLGNAAQVAGYKTGMIFGGGVLVWISAYTGWNGLFFTMAFLAVLPLILILLYQEDKHRVCHANAHPKAADFFKALQSSMRVPGAGYFILFIATYKIGESMIDVMFKPFLVDNGFSAQQIGLWVGTYGMAASLIGSVAGGLLAARQPFLRAVFIAVVLRFLPLVGELWLTTITPEALHVIGVTVAEHFFGGLLTTTVFALMMSRVDKQIGATHYTVLAAIEVLGKSPGNLLAGLIAQTFSYTGLFAFGLILSALVLPLYIPLRRSEQTAKRMCSGTAID